MKKCPYCAEEIQSEAIKCRFCGEYLKKRRDNCLIGCLVAIILVCLFFLLIPLLLKVFVYSVFFTTPQLPRYSYPPSTGLGLENMLRDFAEVFKFLWDKLMELLRISTPSYRI